MTVYQFDLKMPWVAAGVSGPVSSNSIQVRNETVGGITAGQADDIASMIAGLYKPNDTVIMSPLLIGSGTYTVTDAEAVRPRQPIQLGSISTDVGMSSLPGEPAVLVSFGRARELGEPSQRTRSRIYIGPLDKSVLDDGGNISNAVMTAFEAELNTWPAKLAAAQCTWVLGSMTHGFKPVLGWKVRNECGTVGKRQLPITALRQGAI